MGTRRLAELALAALAGALAVVPNDPALRALTAFVALSLYCALVTRPRTTAGHAFLCGLAFGTAGNAIVLGSLATLLVRFAHLPAAVCFALALLAWLAQALPHALASTVAACLRARGVPTWLSLPLALTAAFAYVPQLFPWHPATTQLGFLPCVQLAEVGGESLIDLLLTLATAACARLVTVATSALPAPRPRLVRPALVLALCTLGPVGYGALRMRTIARERAAAPSLAVGIVQGNVDVTSKHDARSAAAILASLRVATRALEQQGAALTVWGETAYPYPLRRSARRAPDDERRVVGDGVRGPVLLGVETWSALDDDAPRFNSAWLVTSDGALGDRADKVRLVPFGEYVPLVHALAALGLHVRSPGFVPGEGGVIRVDGTRLGILVCYEDLFGDIARATVRRGASLLVNLTNDAWFGRSRAPHLHDLAARMRAVELRRDLIRAVNTGVSSLTSATGESLVSTNVFEPAHRVLPARLMTTQTPFALLGDWVPPCCLLALFACALSRGRRRPARARYRASPARSTSGSRLETPSPPSPEDR